MSRNFEAASSRRRVDLDRIKEGGRMWPFISNRQKRSWMNLKGTQGFDDMSTKAMVEKCS